MNKLTPIQRSLATSLACLGLAAGPALAQQAQQPQTQQSAAEQPKGPANMAPHTQSAQTPNGAQSQANEASSGASGAATGTDTPVPRKHTPQMQSSPPNTAPQTQAPPTANPGTSSPHADRSDTLRTPVAPQARDSQTPSSDRQTLGEFTSDAVITTKIKASMMTDGDVSAMDVKVETTDGVVQLTGEVDTAAQAGVAERIARETDGVKRVQNDLRIKAIQ